MAEVDRITESGKKAIANLLNQAWQVEYGLILNYPRILDQLINIDQVPDEQFTWDFERLGKESYTHAGLVIQLITQLGGEPQWGVEITDRMIDVGGMLALQLEKEKSALSIYQQAKLVAQQNQAKGKGFLGRLVTWGDEESREFVSRSTVINILNRLTNDEMGHIKLAERLILASKKEPEQ